MVIRVFHTFNEELKSCWLDLESRTEPYIFQRYHWLSHWQDTIGNKYPGTEPSVVLLEDSDGPQALIPFGFQKRHGLWVLSFLGGDQSDYHCPMATQQGKEKLQRPDSWCEIFENLPEFDVLHINKIPESVLDANLLPMQGARCVLFNYAYAAEIPSTWQEFQKGLRSRIKSDSRRQRKRLAEHGELHFEDLDLESEKSKLIMETFFKQKRTRFKDTGVVDNLSMTSYRRFYSDMRRYIGEGARVTFSVLWMDEKILATHWGAVDHNRFYYLMPTFAREWKSYSPGRLLLEHLIQWSIEQNLKIFDFTVGVEEYKKDWCNRNIKLQEILLPQTLKGRLYMHVLMAKRRLKKSDMILDLVRLSRKWQYGFAAKVRNSGKPEERFVPGDSEGRELVNALHPSRNKSAIRLKPTVWGNATETIRYLYYQTKPLLRTSLYNSARLPLVKQILRRWQGAFAIFCMHRVLPEEQVNSNDMENHYLTLSTNRFTEILKFLKSSYKIVSMDDLVDHMKNGSCEKVACLTFDDGYLDNKDYALPILEQFNCPATIYVTTRFSEGDTSMWWYELWDHLKSKERLVVEFEGKTRKWDCSNQSKKKRCYLGLNSWMMTLTLERQKALLSAITETEVRQSYSNICLNWDDIIKLDRHPLVTIGAHSHSHSVLSMENETIARDEILSSKVLLEQRLGHTVDHFAYPFGSTKEAGTREYKLTEECGFRTATTTNCFRADFSHRFQLPRYGISGQTTPASVENRIGGLSNLLERQIA